MSRSLMSCQLVYESDLIERYVRGEGPAASERRLRGTTSSARPATRR